MGCFFFIIKSALSAQSRKQNKNPYAKAQGLKIIILELAEFFEN